jgi:hypothetical protein
LYTLPTIRVSLDARVCKALKHFQSDWQELLGLDYDEGPLAFIKKLLLLGNFFKAWLLQSLKLRTVYRNTKVHTSKQYNK